MLISLKSIDLKKDKRLYLLGFLILSVISYYGYQFYLKWKGSHSITLLMPECDLGQGACFSTLPTGEKIELRIKPTHMPVLTSVQLEVKTEQIPVKKISIHFKGAEMDMGEFKYTLMPQKGNIFSAQTILPTCIQDSMVWHAVVHVQTSQKLYIAPFLLVNQKPTNHPTHCHSSH
jgi:hypothetical protein